MDDEFTNNVPHKFPNTTSKGSEESEDPAERPWDVPRNGPRSLQRLGEDLRRDDLTQRVDKLYSDLRSSLTIRSALEYDRNKVNQLLDEVNRIKGEVEKIVEMLRVMEEYVKERIS